MWTLSATVELSRRNTCDGRRVVVKVFFINVQTLEQSQTEVGRPYFWRYPNRSLPVCGVISRKLSLYADKKMACASSYIETVYIHVHTRHRISSLQTSFRTYVIFPHFCNPVILCCIFLSDIFHFPHFFSTPLLYYAIETHSERFATTWLKRRDVYVILNVCTHILCNVYTML